MGEIAVTDDARDGVVEIRRQLVEKDEGGFFADERDPVGFGRCFRSLASEF
jgi:hypothetical protein